MQIDLPDIKDQDLIIRIRNYQMISSMLLTQEHVDYALRQLFKRHSERKVYKFKDLEGKKE